MIPTHSNANEFYISVSQILIWTSFNILLILLFINKLNKIFDTCSLYICMSHDLTFVKIMLQQYNKISSFNVCTNYQIA